MQLFGIYYLGDGERTLCESYYSQRLERAVCYEAHKTHEQAAKSRARLPGPRYEVGPIRPGIVCYVGADEKIVSS